MLLGRCCEPGEGPGTSPCSRGPTSLGTCRMFLLWLAFQFPLYLLPLGLFWT